VLVVDANGCSTSTSAVLNGTPALTISLSSQPTTCGLNNGSVSIAVTTGTAPFTFAWSNGATSQNVSGLPNGNYNVTVTDG
jgi:hypothetical protein